MTCALLDTPLLRADATSNAPPPPAHYPPRTIIHLILTSAIAHDPTHDHPTQRSILTSYHTHRVDRIHPVSYHSPCLLLFHSLPLPSHPLTQASSYTHPLSLSPAYAMILRYDIWACLMHMFCSTYPPAFILLFICRSWSRYRFIWLWLLVSSA